jgi:hypothetical protein
MSRVGLAELDQSSSVHLDIDATVERVGQQQGTLSRLQPALSRAAELSSDLAVIAETKLCIGAERRPGDRRLGDDDAKTIGRYVRSVRGKMACNAVLTVRMAPGADCTEVCAPSTAPARSSSSNSSSCPSCSGAMLTTTQWRTVDVDADGKPLRQVAELSFRRDGWTNAGKAFRVIAARYRDRDSGKQVQLWSDLDYCVKAFVPRAGSSIRATSLPTTTDAPRSSRSSPN